MQRLLVHVFQICRSIERLIKLSDDTFITVQAFCERKYVIAEAIEKSMRIFLNIRKS